MNTAQRITVMLLGMALGAAMVLTAATLGAARANADTEGVGVIAAQCRTDEGGIRHHPCFWDARHQGNGEGRSFKRRWNGTVKYISHARAHCMTHWHAPGTCPSGGFR